MIPGLRIVAGRFRGRRLEAPAGDWLRPTADRMKESIYNVLQAHIRGARVLDLFAGTGNLGLEACSRGATAVVLVERSPQARRCIERNLSKLDGGPGVRVVAADAVRYLRESGGERFDVVLADPPYDAGVEDELMAALPGSGLRVGGVFVLQHGRNWSAMTQPPGFRPLRSKRFGDTVVDFWLREEANDDAER